MVNKYPNLKTALGGIRRAFKTIAIFVIVLILLSIAAWILL